jgi:hypothetical protein
MSKTYRVFLGAPSIADIQRDITSYSWRTFSSSSSSDTTPLSKKSTRLLADQTGPSILGVSQTEAISTSNGSAVEDDDAPVRSQVQSASVILTVDLLEMASERISMIYKDATFGVDDEELAQAGSGQPLSEENEEKEVEISVFHGAGMIPVISEISFV